MVDSMTGLRQLGRPSRPGHLFDAVKWTLASARTMREGLRFGQHLPAETQVPAVARSNGINPLEEYFNAVAEGPGIWKFRHYFPIYHRHLAKFVGHEVHVVEIGIYSGGSLPMWRSYFGPGCRVYGVDIDPACATHEREGVRVFIGDQADPDFWERFVAEVPRIDVVIDDGGHELHQQITTLRCLLPRMAMGGVYICEDIFGDANLFHSFVDGLAHQLSSMRWELGPDTGTDNAPAQPDHEQVDSSAPGRAVHQQIASVHHYPLLTVIEKPEREVERFETVKRGTVWHRGSWE
jgi:hypothetical protein